MLTWIPLGREETIAWILSALGTLYLAIRVGFGLLALSA